MNSTIGKYRLQNSRVFLVKFTEKMRIPESAYSILLDFTFEDRERAFVRYDGATQTIRLFSSLRKVLVDSFYLNDHIKDFIQIEVRNGIFFWYFSL